MKTTTNPPTTVITVKCERCLGVATGLTLQEATDKINHAVGLSRGIKCGDNYDRVVQVKKQNK